uniref:Uncharacterized protein n=1 Tax=Paraburkholderia sprentiae WSM5005 TaxID=754502 RepID=A0A1I9YIB5_9BURK
MQQGGTGLAADAARFDSRHAIETISIIHFSMIAHMGTLNASWLARVGASREQLGERMDQHMDGFAPERKRS